jgi:hypothetical protein
MNIAANPSWQGIVFSLIWLYDAQNFVIGEIPQELRAEISDLVAQSRSLKPDNKEIFWTSIYADNGVTTNIKYSKQLMNYFNNLRYQILEFYCKRINGFGTLINPVDSVAQDFHIDYTWSYTSIFIPIENCNTSNMTQIITGSFLWGWFCKSRNMPESSMSNICATIFAPKPWSMLLLPPSTYHRGVKNTSNADRTMFWISYQSESDPIERESAVQDFTKKSIDL